jgi:hypothetical protein
MQKSRINDCGSRCKYSNRLRDAHLRVKTAQPWGKFLLYYLLFDANAHASAKVTLMNLSLPVLL